MAQRRNESELFQNDINRVNTAQTTETTSQSINDEIHHEEPVPPVIHDEVIQQTVGERLGNLAESFSRGFTSFISFFRKKHRCPYCFDTVSKRNTRPVEVLIGGHVNRNQRIRTSSNQNATLIPFCSSCNNNLPADYFDSQSKNIAVIGGLASGKSTYITVLIDLLLNHKSLINDLGLHCVIVNSDGKELYEEYREQLIEKKEKLFGTNGSRNPILLRINSQQKTLFLSLFDTEGEEFKSVEGILSKHPHVFHTNAILFLLNPLSIKGIFDILRDEKQDEYAAQKTSDDTYEIIQNIHDVFSRRKEKYANKPLDIPVAFGISKADEIEEIANIYIPNDYEEEYIDFNNAKTDLDFSSEDLEEFLTDTDPRLVSNIRQNYKKYRIFPVSPMGCRVGSQLGRNHYLEYEPKGVLNPILWLLSELKFI